MAIHDRNQSSAAPPVYSVSTLNRLARELLESGFSRVVVEGEISGLRRYSSGHWYFSLKDRDAQLRCVMFRGNNIRVRFKPADGDKVAAQGDLTIYEARGDFQLKVALLEKSGSGELRLAFERLKAKLRAEGLFEQTTKKPVDARFIRHVGVITSPSGAVLRDMLSVFHRRFPATRITLLPVAVQGENAAGEICRALANANALRGKPRFDALIVGRGGGSAEDLQAFNEESVARAIFASELPVVSAVGHETDFCIADFVADLRAPTPSAAAELLSPSQDEYRERLQANLDKLRGRMGQALERRRERLRLISRRLRSPARRLEDHAQALDELSRRLRRALALGLDRKRGHLDACRRRLDWQSPALRIDRLRGMLNALPRRLRRAMLNRLRAHGAALAELSRALHSTGPLNTLARGYSITLNESAQVIRSLDDITLGSRVITRLADGRLESRVVALAPEPEIKAEAAAEPPRQSAPGARIETKDGALKQK